MKNGLSLAPRIELTIGDVTPKESTPDLTNYAAWLELQSSSTVASILDVTANELYRRQNWPGIAGRLKDVVRDLRAVVRLEP